MQTTVRMLFATHEPLLVMCLGGLRRKGALWLQEPVFSLCL